MLQFQETKNLTLILIATAKVLLTQTLALKLFILVFHFISAKENRKVFIHLRANLGYSEMLPPIEISAFNLSAVPWLPKNEKKHPPLLNYRFFFLRSFKMNGLSLQTMHGKAPALLLCTTSITPSPLLIRKVK